MSHRYTIEIKYNATYTADVVAEDEGEALAKARLEAEEADSEQFSILGETATRVIDVR